MKDREIQLWEWLRRDRSGDCLAEILAAAEVEQDKFFRAAGQLCHMMEKAGKRKMQHPDDELQKLHNLRIARLKKNKARKKAKKYLQIERQYWAIQNMRREGASWSDVRQYLKRYNRIDVSKAYFFKVIKELGAKHRET